MTVEELQELEIIDEKKLEDMIYTVRGQKVMLDFELAKIYGYETRYFNRQIKNNIERFDNDFMFKLNSNEFNEILMSQNVTSSWGGTRKLPYAFTEQGIYMLMTVLRGELAVKQSKMLIRAFKTMKDIITDSSHLLTTGEILQLANQVNDNSNEINKLKNKNKYIQSQLKVVMDNFKDPTKYKEYVVFADQRLEASDAFMEIYQLAKHSIIIVDDYISSKTLLYLKKCPSNVDITIYSDNKANKQERIDINIEKQAFLLDKGIDIDFKPTNNKIHDRLIFIDYDTDNEKVYLCGSSSKDTGNRISMIMEINDSCRFHEIINELNK